MTNGAGPYLTAALICERVLAEQDGVNSVIRIIDRVFFMTGEDGEPVDPQYPFMLLLIFKSGTARGSYTVAIEMEKPSGERVPLLQAPILLEGEERGANIVLQTALEPDQAGLYWFDVLFQGDRVTRIPLRAVYQSPPTTGRVA